jgi:hypothetical protein
MPRARPLPGRPDRTARPQPAFTFKRRVCVSSPALLRNVGKRQRLWNTAGRKVCLLPRPSPPGRVSASVPACLSPGQKQWNYGTAETCRLLCEITPLCETVSRKTPCNVILWADALSGQCSKIIGSSKLSQKPDIYYQTHNNIVHPFRFRKPNVSPHSPRAPCPYRQMFPFYLLRVFLRYDQNLR